MSASGFKGSQKVARLSVNRDKSVAHRGQVYYRVEIELAEKHEGFRCYALHLQKPTRCRWGLGTWLGHILFAASGAVRLDFETLKEAFVKTRVGRGVIHRQANRRTTQ